MTATEERPQTSPAGGNGHFAAPERPALDVSDGHPHPAHHPALDR